MVGLKSILAKILRRINIYGEVGAIFITTASTNPATVFGGTWSKITDRYLVGTGTLGLTYTVNGTGGAYNAVIPYHRHHYGQIWSTGSGGSYSCYKKTANRKFISATRTTQTVGSSATNANLPQYYAVYIWRRTTSSATLTYNANGGALGSVPSTVTMTTANDTYITTATPTPPTETGYQVNFLGWAMAPEAGEPQFYAGDTFKQAGVDPVASTLYAVYERILLNFTITLERNNPSGGGVAGGGSSFTIESTCTPVATPSAGYIFAGWFDNPYGRGIPYSTELTYDFTPTGSQTIYAIFLKENIVNFSLVLDSLENVYEVSSNQDMNWREWCNSGHNIYALDYNDDGVLYQDAYYIGTWSSNTFTPVLPTDTISSNTTYYISELQPV